ncbi:GNAT family N-acetyltransferase [Chitinimonas sp. BJYL2]|uniref:GNAT family N-acetyltransferase n=1 Tax=Chitinimonas sp. BJYL2 TaxID=2976696 RepID=UPI0022B30081|nr:GNAT family N-acetyltransferase [Chitinimonas sp. BJYL2]
MRAAPVTWSRGAYEVSTDLARLDLSAAHQMIAGTYWAADIPFETFRRSVEGAYTFGVYHAGELIGLARVISDGATIAYLGDVYITEAHRGQGLARWLLDCIDAHPDLQGLRRWILLTRDAHALYQQAGYTALAAPERWMERAVPNPYRKPAP